MSLNVDTEMYRIFLNTLKRGELLHFLGVHVILGCLSMVEPSYPNSLGGSMTTFGGNCKEVRSTTKALLGPKTKIRTIA